MTRFLQAAVSLSRRLGHGLRGQGRAGRLASLGLIAVLIALPGFALWGATSTYWTGGVSKTWGRWLAESTSRAEGTVDQLVSARMNKRRQMRWSPRGAHRVLQVRAAVLDGRFGHQAIPLAA